MIYSYYCVDCGKKWKGGDIAFNLSRMLELERRKKNQAAADGTKPQGHMKENFNDPLTLYVAWKDLCAYAANSNITQFENKKVVRIKVTLKDVMDLYAEKAENQSSRQKILDMGIDDIWKGKFVPELKDISGQNEAVVQKEADEVGRRLKMIFSKEESDERKAEGSPIVSENSNSVVKKVEEEKKAYYKEILISPEFIENVNNPEGLYTVRYSPRIINERNMECFRYEGEEIRGYCPECHAPVLKGAGKYRHMPIGFIGGSRAGKTSLIIAMLSELLNNPTSDFPKVIELADSRIMNLKRQEMLYQKGWKVEKTQQESVKDSFNASVWVRNQNRNGEYVIFTLVDIAGELCLNSDKKFDEKALEKYPLIGQCSLYLLCTCISDAGFRVDGGKGGIDNGIFAIVQGIADAFDWRGEWLPPIGIVLTKADYVETVENVKPVRDNPFQEHGMVYKEEYFARGREMLTRLGRIYAMYSEQPDYNKPLAWVCKLFQDYREKTYFAMFYCSATGKESKIYTDEGTILEDIKQNVDSEGNEIHFKAANVDTLLWWILQIAGCVPVKDSGGYCCYDIPVYGEAYVSRRYKLKSNGRIRQEWPWEEWKERNDAVCRLFLNQSELDESLINIIQADREDSPVLRFLKRIFGVTLERKSLKAVKMYLNGK